MHCHDNLLRVLVESHALGAFIPCGACWKQSCGGECFTPGRCCRRDLKAGQGGFRSVEKRKLVCCMGQVVKMLARLYHRVGAGQKAIEVLEGHMGSHPEATDLTDVNILAELYMEKEHFGKAVALIGQAEQRLCAGSGLPIDLAASPCIPELM